MTQPFSQTDQIIDTVNKVPDCRIEELVSLIPDLTWFQLFREVNRLSRTGHVRLVLDGRGIFTVRSVNESLGKLALPY